MSCKKIIFLLVLVIFLFNLRPLTAKAAMTTEEIIAEITKLQSLIEELRKQLKEVKKPDVWCHDFNLNLKITDNNEEVRQLQTALLTEKLFEREISGDFDEYTASVVVVFQEKHKKDILTPLGLKNGTGFVGSATRSKLNGLYGCGIVPPVSACQMIWWNDNDHKYCQQKEFCGTYMYLGLHTFVTKEQCEADLVVKPLTCTDSDGGKNYYLKGQTMLQTGANLIDNCPANSPYKPGITLLESYCTNESPFVVYQEYDCPNGCQDGACKSSASSANCTDSDGGINFNVKGTVQTKDSISTGSYYDLCWNGGNELHEWSCNGTQAKETIYACPDGCQDGACIKIVNTENNAYTVTIRASDPSDFYTRDWNIFTYDPTGTYIGNGKWSSGTPLKTSYYTRSGTWSVNFNSGTYYLVIGQTGGESYGSYSGEISISGVSMQFTNADINHAIKFNVPLQENANNKCVNHAQCSQACDNLGIDSKWMGSVNNSWTGTCPLGVYGCITGSCCLGQCDVQQGSCLCKKTNIVDIYGNVCPSGQTCGDDCKCHGDAVTETPAGYEISNAKLGGEGDTITVKPGQSISLTFDYKIWSRTGCPGCIDQLILGLDDKVLNINCAYHGIPGAAPGRSGSYSGTIPAPEIEGTYSLYTAFATQYTCEAAKGFYPNTGYSGSAANKKIGTITVFGVPSSGFTEEVNPYQADVQTCTNSASQVLQTTGEGSAPWFLWGGCAREKYYEVNPGEELRFHIYTDSCAGCVCYYPKFYLYEFENEQWVKKQTFDFAYQKGITIDEKYVPNSNKIKIEALKCFYLDIFRMGG